MNEKEALTGLKNLSQIFKLCSENDVKLKDFNIMNPKAYKEEIETILDLYNKEKEKNKELYEALERSSGRVTELTVENSDLKYQLYHKQQMIDELTQNEENLKIELGKEKEKNKELEKYKTYYEEMEEVNKKFIAVNKIKEKIKEYQALLYSYQKKQEKKLEYVDKGSMNCILAQISILNSLLEEK